MYVVIIFLLTALSFCACRNLEFPWMLFTLTTCGPSRIVRAQSGRDRKSYWSAIGGSQDSCLAVVDSILNRLVGKTKNNDSENRHIVNRQKNYTNQRKPLGWMTKISEIGKSTKIEVTRKENQEAELERRERSMKSLM